MNIHEYQAKAILKSYGVAVLEGYLVEAVNQLETQARKIQTDVAVVKAQIHAGGRGKAGGVKVVDSLNACIEIGTEMLGKPLVTHQTGPNGQKIRKIYIEEGCEIESEFYMSMVLDRTTSKVMIIASKEGGMDIEEVAKRSSNSILKITIDPLIGIRAFHIRILTESFGLSTDLMPKLEKIVKGMYTCFVEKDLNLVEINPFVLSKEGQLIVLDAKMNFDDNALFRHADIERLRDFDEEDSKEIEASSVGLSYVALEGEIGCLVNGAGLAMATMDAIHYAGGRPANFLDVGGSASAEMVSKALDIILSDEHVKGVFINIFGGIMHCNTIAEGIIQATKSLSRSVPIVVRLEGTNVADGKRLLDHSGLDIISADTMDEGAEKIVSLIKGEEAIA
ncbi:ADP-forming succinate--CoA ligase subunit beta [Fusibacter ferrireducens]|uniref:Succinate--CoA ligase [ADP-forming] subunit beta n=1 Tax=Fusibacter ferrireducens TaxID=2785058 RepID=A0ABS0A2C0_9FIRM|nr:ADP-forming succinate--CoA ligase subunit beta [Fusibacter ferrireducens]MBF4696034.1 ADP-forming succinate--CoA ligase subunit beta [Fusibacter ferrireducens]